MSGDLIDQIARLIAALEAFQLTPDQVIRQTDITGFEVGERVPAGYYWNAIRHRAQAQELKDAQGVPAFQIRMEDLLKHDYQSVVEGKLFIKAVIRLRG